MKYFRSIPRLLIGIIFTYSGFVKGVDPMGTMFKIEDYFIAYGMDWLMPIALFGSVFLCAFEFMLGISMLFNVRVKKTFPFLVLMMVFFTIITFFDAIYNPVPDCGCFGEALILTNWQTFWKNVFIMGLILMMYISRKKAAPSLKISAQNTILIIGSVAFIAFSIYNYMHLPVVDFREWKVGKQMYAENQEPIQFYVSYTNNESSEEKEFLSPNYPYSDSLWLSQWTYKSSRTVDPNEGGRPELQITDEYGTDVTESYIKNPDYQFLIIAWELDDVNKKAEEVLNTLYNDASAKEISVAMLSPALENQIQAYREESKAEYEILSADDIELKTMVRARPGIMLMKGGTVVNKWNWRDFPGVETALPKTN